MQNALEKFREVSYLTPKLSEKTARLLVNRIVWDLFDQSKTDTIKVLVGPVFLSIRVERLSELIERLVGKRQTQNVQDSTRHQLEIFGT